MATKKLPRPDLSEEDRQKRQEEVYRLHCRGLTVRAIGAELGLDVSQVQRALVQAKAAIRKQKGAKHLADLADRMTEGAWAEMADSHRVSERAEAVTEWTDLRIELPCPDWKTIATERANRIKLRDQIAKFNGLDPIKTAELELKRRQADALDRGAKAAEGLLQQWAAWDCGAPDDPDA